MFPQFFKNSLNGIDMSLTYIFYVDQDVIQVTNHKNVKFFGQDLMDITLEAGEYVW